MNNHNPFNVGDRVVANREMYNHFGRNVHIGDKATITRLPNKHWFVELKWDFRDEISGCFVSAIDLLTGQRLGHDSALMFEEQSE